MSFFDQLSRLGIPVYYVSGNHDRWRPDFESVLKAIEGYGVTILEGQTVALDLPGGRVNLCGLREYAGADACAGALASAFSGLSQDAYNILLSHRPDYIELYRRYPFDLVPVSYTHLDVYKRQPYMFLRL